MKNTLKYKILTGFLLILMLLVLVGAYSIYEFKQLSNNVNSILEDNYKSIKAAKTLSEALEREDSGILLILLGKTKEGWEIIESADSAFQTALIIVKMNLTEPNENDYVENIKKAYVIYKESWYPNFSDTAFKSEPNYYMDSIQNHFLILKNNINALTELNQNSLYNEASLLKEKSKRAIMPGIVAIISAIIFLILLNFFINQYFIKPIKQITIAIQNHYPSSVTFNSNVKSKDEIKEIEKAVQSLIERLSNKSDS
jgi:methyl-accepting chemotaxis protein